jgi:hypothetical protein
MRLCFRDTTHSIRIDLRSMLPRGLRSYLLHLEPSGSGRYG